MAAVGAVLLQTCFVSQSLTALPFSWIFTQSFSVACCESLFPAQASESRIIIRANAPAGYPEQWLIIARLNYPTVAQSGALKSPLINVTGYWKNCSTDDHLPTKQQQFRHNQRQGRHFCPRRAMEAELKPIRRFLIFGRISGEIGIASLARSRPTREGLGRRKST